MARSSYIYVIRTKPEGYFKEGCHQNQPKVLGTFTVKTEAHIQACNLAVSLQTIELARYPDGRLSQPDVIPWDLKLIEQFT